MSFVRRPTDKSAGGGPRSTSNGKNKGNGRTTGTYNQNNGNNSLEPIVQDQSFVFDKGVGNSLSTNRDVTLAQLFGGMRTDSLDSLLSSLIAQRGEPLSGEQSNDWNKFIIETIIALAKERENRSYNEGLRDEDRQYNSPINQLLRLMGTGMSRDAALQMISGSGSGSGTGVPYAQSLSLGSALDPSASRLNAAQADAADAQTRYALANTVFNGVGALCGLTGAGIGIAQAIPQIKMLTASAFMSQETLKSYKSVNAVSNSLQGLMSGSTSIAESINGLSNAEDLNKYLQNEAANNPTIQQLIESPDYKSALGTTIGRQMFNDMWKGRRDSRDAGTLYDEYVRNNKLQNAVMESDISKVGAEMALMGSEKDLNTQKLVSGLYEIAMLDEKTAFQNETHEARVQAVIKQNALLDNQIITEEYAGKNLRQEYELNEFGMPVLKQCYLEELNNKLAYWTTINDPKQRAEQVSAWKKDAANQNLASYLEYMYLNAAGTFASSNRKTWLMLSGFSAAGAISALPTAGDGIKAVKTMYDIGKDIMTVRVPH